MSGHPAFHLVGDLARPARLTVGDLRAWPQHRVEGTFDCASEGPRRHRFEGPLLREVVAQAGPAFDPRLRKDRLRFLLAVTGADGHHAVLSWGEIDPDFGNTPVLLATCLDGVALDGVGPQLVLPRDRCGARYVSAIAVIEVRAHPGPDLVKPLLQPSPPTVRAFGA